MKEETRVATPENRKKELRHMKRLKELIDEVDVLLENALRTRAGMDQIVPRSLQLVREHMLADGAMLRARDESGEWTDFRDSPDDVFADLDVDEITSIVEDLESYQGVHGGTTVYAYRLDVSHSYLGTVIVRRPGQDREAETFRNLELLRSWAEHVDNFVASVNEARRKQQALAAISDAFKAPTIEAGLDAALAELDQFVHYDDLVIVCQSERILDRRAICYRIVTDGELRYASSQASEPRIELLLERAVNEILDFEREDDILKELGVDARVLEDVAILGSDGTTVIGRIIVGTNHEPLTPFSRDILDRFADYLRQRVVDFNREWRLLSRTFPQTVVDRLLREEGYEEKYLSPREREVAIMFVDICGFTRVSEQVLKSPEAIAELVDRWSHHVVEIIWETGGVFDKMVGDCIIGLWGPPYFETSPGERCQSAVTAARRIRDFTAGLRDRIDLPAVQKLDEALAVSTGVNYGPLYVGLMGPNHHYTGFSSTMNNTQRLQDLAAPGEILCMDSVVEAREDLDEFGDERRAAVKNVSRPLVFRPVED